MNIVYFSPDFPPNYYQFCVGLQKAGARVLGLGSQPLNSLRPELRSALDDYVQVSDLHNYDELIKACGYFTYRYGKIDGLDSHTEYWLEIEARLRTDFNIPGIQAHDIDAMKRKSLMKQKFIEAGVAVAEGELMTDLDGAIAFARRVGYPVIAKPDIGVGAAKTYRLDSPADIEHFFTENDPTDYFIEGFVEGQIFSFDGLLDHEGNLVFFTSHAYSQGIMETVLNEDHIYYYSLREIPPDLEAAGRSVLKAYDLKARFFHLEFFRRKSDGTLLGLEVNMRPPGGHTTDMFNFANDINIYDEWANMVVSDQFKAKYTRPYHCCYVGRRNRKKYRYTHAELTARFGKNILLTEAINPVYAGVMGDYAYLVRSPQLSETIKMAETIHEEMQVS